MITLRNLELRKGKSISNLVLSLISSKQSLKRRKGNQEQRLKKNKTLGTEGKIGQREEDKTEIL